MKAPERGALPLGLAATLGRTYGRLTETVQGLTDADFERETRCAGMPVGPLLVHLLYDAQRALIAFASPATADPDRDFVTYWQDFPPRSESDAEPDTKFVRGVAAAYRKPGLLVQHWREVSEAAVRAAAVGLAVKGHRIETQGHVLRREGLRRDFGARGNGAPSRPDRRPAGRARTGSGGAAGDGPDAGRPVRPGGVGRDRLGHHDVRAEGNRPAAARRGRPWTCSARTRTGSRCWARARALRRTGRRGPASPGWRARTRSAGTRRGSTAGGPDRDPSRSRRPCTPRGARSRTTRPACRGTRCTRPTPSGPAASAGSASQTTPRLRTTPSTMSSSASFSRAGCSGRVDRHSTVVTPSPLGWTRSDDASSPAHASAASKSNSPVRATGPVGTPSWSAATTVVRGFRCSSRLCSRSGAALR